MEIVVRVSRGPRRCYLTRRWQQNNEEMTIDVRDWPRYRRHCVIVSDVPPGYSREQFGPGAFLDQADPELEQLADDQVDPELEQLADDQVDPELEQLADDQADPELEQLADDQADPELEQVARKRRKR